MPETERVRGSPRLKFTKEELESTDSPALSRAAEKAERAADRYDKAQKKLKTRQRLKLTVEERDADQSRQSGQPVAPAASEPAYSPVTDNEQSASGDVSPAEKQFTRRKPIRENAEPVSEKVSDIADQEPLRLSGEAVPKTDAKAGAAQPAKKKAVRLKLEEEQVKPPSKVMHPVQKTIRTASDQLHRQIAAANEDDNAAASAVLQADRVTQSALQMGEHAYHARKLRTYRRAEQAERALDKANINYLELQRQHDHPQFSSNPVSRWQQKRAIRREYAAAKAGRAAGGQAQRTAGQTVKASSAAATDTAKKAADSVRKNPQVLLIGLLAGMLALILVGFQSCTPIAQSILESIVIGTYPATEDDVRAAERAYAAKERELQNEMDHYERYHPGYDEYIVKADEIWHDPYVLIAIISAYYDGQDWDMDKAYPVIEKYFALQYIVTESISSETRYRTETDYVYDPDTGRMVPTTTQVPYTYQTCTVRMENKNLSHLPVVSMSHHTMGMYALYMATHGNMEGIFAGNPHATPLKDPMLYDIPQETLDADPSFARLMEEAEKYIGYPYVWGGASPETSFDCSGFVSYVFTNSGVYNIGRLGATGLRGLCRNVTPENARPGDIVFFEGTMGADVDGITHCGIYVGNNMMIHCGSPIGYAKLTDSYWRQHFHSFGRVPN